jgi:hypothetical protein
MKKLLLLLLLLPSVAFAGTESEFVQRKENNPMMMCEDLDGKATYPLCNADNLLITSVEPGEDPLLVEGLVTSDPATVGVCTVTSVSDTNVSTQLLAANSGRYAVTFYNDSTAIMYLRLEGAAASATAFTVKLQPEDYFEVTFRYTGAIRAVWASDASGAVRITECV